MLNGAYWMPVAAYSSAAGTVAHTFLRHALRAGVAVVHRVAEQGTVGVQQAVVDGPAVDAHGIHPARRPQPVQDPAVQREHVPAQPLRHPHRPVGEPVRLAQLHRVRAHPAHDHPPAGGTEVDRGVRLHPGAHRRNAAPPHPRRRARARPVVWVRSPPVSANTAFATCSGSTSR